ncbi:MAG TPA: helix-turn-helix transcriptional regulator [Candidatus Cybelea sp.]|jgi:DNA-binding PadR family transcriptional regulator|nr:helix-turn-helix transcriptional regulator [Candidatus Cybelea sp.]
MNMGFWHDPRSGWWSWHGRGFHKRPTRMRRGILKFILLKLLSELPRHGYELIRAVREKGLAGAAGSIYPLLSALEAAGLITGRDEGDRRIYEIAEKGRRLLEEHIADLRHFFEDEDEDDATSGPGEQLRESAARLMQSISQLGPSSKPETIERVRELLDEVRKQIYEVLAEE